MKKSVRFLFATVLAIAIGAGAATAHETDQFTLPPGRAFADLGPYLNQWAYQRIEAGVKKTNEKIRRALDANRREQVAELQSPYEIGMAVNAEFPPAYDVIEGLNKLVESTRMKQRYPGLIVGYSSHLGNIYQKAHFVLDPRQIFRIWHAQTIYAYGVYFGTDKVGHFTDMGRHYYRAYHKARTDGKTEEEAVAEAVGVGTHGPIFSERGMVGYLSAGAYSNGDLAANYLGFLFYKNLTDSVELNGRTQPPMLTREGDYWAIAPHVGPSSNFFAAFICDHFNEALNPSHFESGMRGPVRGAVKERTEIILARYCDAHGKRRPQAWFEKTTEALRTYHGQDYGYRGPADELITIANTCFESLPGDGPVDGRTSSGFTPLHLAAAAGNIEVVNDLIKRGAKVNARIQSDESYSSEWGATPLHYAARDGRLEAAQALVAGGADVNAADAYGVTALHRAADHAELIAFLLDHGANGKAVDAQGQTALHWAALTGPDEALARLLEGGASDLKIASACGETAVHVAARAGRAGALKQLVEGGGAVDTDDGFGVTPLHLAARSGNMDAVNALLQAGASADARDAFGWTPLHVAAREGKVEAAAALLARPSDVDAPDARGVTPLHLAARYGHEQVAEILLSHGARAQAQNASGSTPLHEAAFAGHEEPALLLLSHGARADLADARGATPATIATERGHRDLATKIRSNGRVVAVGAR